MVDLLTFVTICAAVASPVVALVAVYLGYWYQLKTQRTGRLAKAFSKVMTDVVNAYRIGSAIGEVTEAVAAFKSAKERPPLIDEDGKPLPSPMSSVDRILGATRMIDVDLHFGFLAPELLRGPSHEAGSALDSLASAEGTYDRARSLFLAKIEDITNSAQAAYMNGAKKEDYDSILAFQQKLVIAVNACKTAKDIEALEDDKLRLGERLRAAAGV